MREKRDFRRISHPDFLNSPPLTFTVLVIKLISFDIVVPNKDGG